MDALDLFEKIEVTQPDTSKPGSIGLSHAELIQRFPTHLETPFGVAHLPDVIAELEPVPDDLLECLLNPDLLYAFAGSCLASNTLSPINQAISQTTAESIDQPFVCCADCQHFQADEIGDGSGIGSCAIDAPASHQLPLMYPRTERYCNQYLLISNDVNPAH